GAIPAQASGRGARHTGERTRARRSAFSEARQSQSRRTVARLDYCPCPHARGQGADRRRVGADSGSEMTAILYRCRPCGVEARVRCWGQIKVDLQTTGFAIARGNAATTRLHAGSNDRETQTNSARLPRPRVVHAIKRIEQL